MIFPRLFFMDYDSFCQNGKNQDSKSKKCVFSQGKLRKPRIPGSASRWFCTPCSKNIIF